MSRASNFIGRPVVTQSGKQIETVDDVVFDPQTHQVLCFVMKQGGGWLGGAWILPWSGQVSIAPNALIVLSTEQIVLARTAPRIRMFLEKTQVVIGRKIVSPDNRHVGVLSDVYFDETTGDVIRYEMAGISPDNRTPQSIALPPAEVEFDMGDYGNTFIVIAPATVDRIDSYLREGGEIDH